MLSEGASEYKIIDESLFDNLFIQTYWDSAGGLRQLSEELLQKE